jgi:anti-sigma factor (TIGR02949 family)
MTDTDDTGDMDCIELVERVTEYLDAALATHERVRFETHVGECPGCEEVLEQFRVVIATTGALRPDDAAAVPTELREQLLAVFREWQGARS